MAGELTPLLDYLTLENIKTALYWLGITWAASLALRLFYTLLGTYFGFYHPADDEQAPRYPWRPVWRAWICLLYTSPSPRDS